MIISGVNFLSFGKRERILKRTHRKYLSYIFVLTSILIIFWFNILKIDREYNKLNAFPVTGIVSNEELISLNNLDEVDFLINEMNLFLERMEYDGENLNMDVRVSDKKYIYDIVDNLANSGFKVNSYEYKSQDRDTYLYTLNIEV